jgi:hypothetical protein
MKKALTLCSVIILSIIITYGQQRTANISFKKIDHNFGTIKEANGPVSVMFRFVNTGSDPALVQNVSTSCGCTTPEYSKAPVLPGDSGFVKVVYNPNGRPGPFTKEITVTSNAGNSPQVLKITGIVEQRERTVEEEFRYAMGNLRLETSHIGFGVITSGTNSTKKIKVTNSSANIVKVQFSNLPAFLKVKTSKFEVKPAEKIEVEITYDAAKRKDWGFLIDYIYLTVDGKQDPAFKLTITADIKEDFSKLTAAQLENAPKISFENINYTFDNISEGSKVENDFKFTNTGKSDLLIRKLTTTCGCTTTSPKDLLIKPGASSSIKATFNTKGYKGSQNKTITVITNDPNSPQVTLWIKGTVQ